MDVDALIVAIVALLFAVSAAGFGVYIQLQTYKATTDHLRGVEGSVSGFRIDMQGLIGELKGMTNTLVDAQQQQFNRMLDAFVTRPGAAAEVAESTGESADRLQQISEEMDALKEELRHAASADEVQHKLDELASRVEAVSATTARAARLAEAAAQPAAPRGSETFFVDKDQREEAYRRWQARAPTALTVRPERVEPGGRVRIEQQGWLPAGDFETLDFTVVSPDGREWTGRLSQDLAGVRRGGGLDFPDAFEGASTSAPGLYEVRVQRVSLDGQRLSKPVSSAFLVEPSEGPRHP